MLDSIFNSFSQASHDKNNSSIEFHNILKETEKYRQIQAAVRNQGEKIAKRQLEEISEQVRKQGRSNFLRNIANISSVQGVNAI